MGHECNYVHSVKLELSYKVFDTVMCKQLEYTIAQTSQCGACFSLVITPHAQE